MILESGGQISRYFLEKGKEVTGIGLELESYDIDLDKLRQQGETLVECNVECMPFEDKHFDAVVASHILEHVENMGAALKEIRRVLKEDGWLLIFIPRFTELVCAGHINTGWNLGQLVYVLLLNRFDVKNGKFIQYGYSLCAYVRKKEIELPALRGDRGDIHILNKAGLWPAPIRKINGIADNFCGDIACINWEHTELLEQKKQEAKASMSRKGRLLNGLTCVMRKVLGRKICLALAMFLIKEDVVCNPKELS